MHRRVCALSLVVCALTGCGVEESDKGTSLTVRPGAAVDLDGDGQPEGFAVDTNGDGKADGVDTDGDGDVDEPLPTGGSSGGGMNATTAGDTAGSAGMSTGGASQGGGDNCEELTARAMPTTPDMLIVLDRSGSMKRGGINRWDPSVRAVKSITSSLDSKIRFGMMLFPKPCGFDDPACFLDACAPGELEVPVAVGTSGAIRALLDMTQPTGGTPTGATLDAARMILDAQAAGPDEVVTPKFILLVTDGQPTCPSGEGSIDATQQELEADKQLTVQAIDALRATGAKTYVIGYDAASDQALASALTEFAQHGGTTDYRPVEDEASLLTEFQRIAGEVVSCSYQLDMEPTDPSYVLVTLDGTQLNLNKPDGWSINSRTVTVEGQACKTLQDGKDHVLNVQVKCDVVPII